MCLGKTPSIIESLKDNDEVFEYYLYFFEMMWSNPIFSDIEDVPTLLKDRVVSLAEKHSIDIEILSNEKYWWLLNISMLHDFAKDLELSYMIHSIGLILDDYKNNEVENLEVITNLLNNALSSQIGEVVAIRPIEVYNQSLPMFKDDFILLELLEQKDEIIRLLKKRLRQKDFNKNVLFGILRIDSSITKKFSTYWEDILDVFVIYFMLMTGDFIYNNYETLEINFEMLNRKRLESVVFAFFENFLVERDLGKPITVELTDIIMEIVNKKYSDDLSI